MNKVIFMGRITRDPEVRYSNGANDQMAIANFSLAVDSGFGQNKKANFFNMVAFGKVAETVEKYLKKGTKILAECEASQNQYKKQDGTKVNTVQFIMREFEFAESKNANQQSANTQEPPVAMTDSDGFMDIPDNIDEELPFN